MTAWIKTLSAETFKAAVQEAMKPEFDELKEGPLPLSDGNGAVEQKLVRLETTIEADGSTIDTMLELRCDGAIAYYRPQSHNPRLTRIRCGCFGRNPIRGH